MAEVAEQQGMWPYEAAWERSVLENKRKMEAFNLRHLSAAIKEALKSPSLLKQKRHRIVEHAVVVPSPPRRSRWVANLVHRGLLENQLTSSTGQAVDQFP